MNDQATPEAPPPPPVRPIRPEPRTFEQFPPESVCPICGTNDEGTCVLVEIKGTAKDGIAEAQPMHLACAIAKTWDRDISIGVTFPNKGVEGYPYSITNGKQVLTPFPRLNP